MASTPYPLPRETRQSAILVGNGTAGPYGPSTFRVFDAADVEVLWRPQGADRYEPTAAFAAAKTSGLAYDTVSVTFDDPVPATTSFVILARRTHERSVAVTRAGAIAATELEKELSKQGTVLSELRRDQSRAASFQPGYDGNTGLPVADAGRALKWSPAGDRLVNSLYDPDQAQADAAQWAELAGDHAAAAAGSAEEAADSAADALLNAQRWADAASGVLNVADRTLVPTAGYATTFADTPKLAEPPLGWSHRWARSGITTRISSDGALGNAVTLSQTSSQRSFLAADIAGAHDAVDVVGLLQVDAILASNAYQAGLVVFGNGDAGSETGYVACLRSGDDLAGTELRLFALANGSFTLIGSAPFAWNAGSLVYIRLRALREGDTVALSARAWAYNTAEPVGWMIDTESPLVLEEGYCGQFLFAASITARLTYFALQRNGLEAPRHGQIVDDLLRQQAMINQRMARILGKGYVRSLATAEEVSEYDLSDTDEIVVQKKTADSVRRPARYARGAPYRGQTVVRNGTFVNGTYWTTNTNKLTFENDPVHGWVLNCRTRDNDGDATNLNWAENASLGIARQQLYQVDYDIVEYSQHAIEIQITNGMNNVHVYRSGTFRSGVQHVTEFIYVPLSAPASGLYVRVRTGRGYWKITNLEVRPIFFSPELGRERVNSPRFAPDPSEEDWTRSNADEITFVNNKMVFDTTASRTADNPGTVNAGETYLVAVKMTDYVSGTVRVRFGTAPSGEVETDALGPDDFDENGIARAILQAVADKPIRVVVPSGTRLKLDVVSVRKILENPLYLEDLDGNTYSYAEGWVDPYVTGAVGDGLLDDTEALSTAIHSTKNVHVPTGTFLTTQAFKPLTRGQRITGDGRDRSWIEAAVSNIHLLKLSKAFQHVEHLGLRGANYAGTGESMSYWIMDDEAQSVAIAWCLVRDADDSGIRIGRGDTGTSPKDSYAVFNHVEKVYSGCCVESMGAHVAWINWNVLRDIKTNGEAKPVIRMAAQLTTYGVWVFQNHIYDFYAGNAGIQMRGDFDSVGDNLIEAAETTARGIALSGSGYHAMVWNNRLNMAGGAGSYGIRFTAAIEERPEGDPAWRNLQIVGNNITNVSEGIIGQTLSPKDSGLIAHNAIHKHTASAIRLKDASGDGINLDEAYFAIVGNIFVPDTEAPDAAIRNIKVDGLNFIAVGNYQVSAGTQVADEVMGVRIWWVEKGLHDMRGVIRVGDDTAVGIPVDVGRLSASDLQRLVTVESVGEMQSVEARVLFGGSPSFGTAELTSSADITTGTLAGTTGVDGRWTVAVAADKLWVENRLGASRDFRFHIGV